MKKKTTTVQSLLLTLTMTANMINRAVIVSIYKHHIKMKRHHFSSFNDEYEQNIRFVKWSSFYRLNDIAYLGIIQHNQHLHYIIFRNYNFAILQFISEIVCVTFGTLRSWHQMLKNYNIIIIRLGNKRHDSCRWNADRW